MGVTGSNVGQYETGIRSPKLETVQKFAETVDVDVSELLDFHGPAQPEGQLTIAGWMPGSCNPAEPGEFAVLVDVGQTKYFRTFMAWDGDGWLMLPSRQQAEILPSWWLRLPPEPEKGETT